MKKIFNMSIILHVLLLCFVYIKECTSQNWFEKISDPNANFYEIQAEARQFFDTNTALISQLQVDNPLYTEFLRWELFWLTRVDGNRQGNMKYANEAMLKYFHQQQGKSGGVCTGANPNSDWTNLGPLSDPIVDIAGNRNGQNMGLIRSIFVNPFNPAIMYAGSRFGGLFKTTNANTSNPVWTCITEPARLPAMGIQSIVTTPDDMNIYIATGINQPNVTNLGMSWYIYGYGLGVFKSTDGGDTWNETGLIFSPTNYKIVTKLLMDPSDNNILYAITSSETEKEVYKTTDGGDNWTSLGFNACFPTLSSLNNLFDIKFVPGNTNNLLVTGVSTGLYLYDNSSTNTCKWYELTNDILAIDLAVSINTSLAEHWLAKISTTPGSSTTPNDIWVLFQGEKSSARKYFIAHSTDAGDTWTSTLVETDLLSTYPPNYKASFSFVVSSENAQNIYAGATDWVGILYKSTDGGTTFIAKTAYNTFWGTTYTHADIRDLILFTSTSSGTDVVYVANDGGVMVTDDGGDSWTNLNGTGLAVTQFYGLSTATATDQIIAGGAHDNGLYTYNNDIWYNINLGCIGDGGEAAIDYNNPQYIYGQGFGVLRHSSNYGLSWACTNIAELPYGAMIRPMQSHPDGYIYIGYHNVGKIKAPATSVTQVSYIDVPGNVTGNLPGSTGAIWDLAVSPSNPDYIYISYLGPSWSDPTNVNYRSTDGGATWTNVFIDATHGQCNTGIAVAYDNPEKVWLSMGNFGPEDPLNPGNYTNRVLYSSDGGTNYVDYSKGLPEFPVNCIVYERGSDDGLYIGTDVGVFYTNNKQYPTHGWICFSENLPVILIQDLEINYISNKIFAATFGRGIWKSPLACPDDYDLTLTSNIASGFYEAENNINITASSGNITNLGNFTARAGNEILITATGTNEVILVPNTHLFIHACDHAGNSFKKNPPLSPQRGEEYSETPESSREIKEPDDERQIVEGQKLKFAYYSNPFRDHLHIDVLLAQPAHLKIEVFNIHGHLVNVLANQNANAGELGFLLNASPLPAGVYFIKVTAGDERLVRTVLKEK